MNRHQASGYRHQGYANETGVALAEAVSNCEVPPLDPVVLAAPTAVTKGLENLKPETCCLMPVAET